MVYKTGEKALFIDGTVNTDQYAELQRYNLFERVDKLGIEERFSVGQ